MELLALMERLDRLSFRHACIPELFAFQRIAKNNFSSAVGKCHFQQLIAQVCSQP
jgi:hypothetical protein